MHFRFLLLVLLAALANARTFGSQRRVDHVAASSRGRGGRQHQRAHRHRSRLDARPKAWEDDSHEEDMPMLQYSDADLVGAISAGACSCM